MLELENARLITHYREWYKREPFYHRRGIEANITYAIKVKEEAIVEWTAAMRRTPSITEYYHSEQVIAGLHTGIEQLQALREELFPSNSSHRV